MSRNQALTSFSQDLYVSHSQIFTYQSCSLKYRFHYVEKRKPERLSIALPFGSAMHAADDDLQMSAYAYLLAANKYVFPLAPVKCRFDVLRKLKTPKLEIVQTVRTAQDRKRFAKIANAVLEGIDAGIYMPQPSWMCSDCAYSKACKSW